MRNKQLHKSFCYIVLAFILTAIFLIPLRSFGARTARAEVSAVLYSDVLDDLQKDEAFNASDYPANGKDYSLKVIQIAESTDGELFIYVYQPAAGTHDLRATSINISTAINDSLYYVNYKLERKNSNGVFYKYKVSGLEVRQEALRYYDITSIFRAWNGDIDESTGNDNEINEVSFEVAQRWTACTVDGKVSYSCGKTETILVTDKYVDFIRYKNKVALGYDWLDAHYVAFSTDLPIDELYEVDISFISQEYREDCKLYVEWKETYAWDKVEHSETFKATDKGENHGGIIHPHYTWDRIQSVSVFKNSVQEQNITLTETAKDNLENKQWVLRFYESEYTEFIQGLNPPTIRWQTRVTDVTILRLKFMTNGVVYNLGVVDNKQAGDDQPGNKLPGIGTDGEGMNFWQLLWDCIAKTFTGAGEWWQVAITVALIIVAIVIVCLIVWFVIGCLRGKKRRR